MTVTFFRKIGYFCVLSCMPEASCEHSKWFVPAQYGRALHLGDQQRRVSSGRLALYAALHVS